MLDSSLFPCHGELLFLDKAQIVPFITGITLASAPLPAWSSRALSDCHYFALLYCFDRYGVLVPTSQRKV